MIDLKEDRRVSTAEGEALAQSYNALFFETSAQDGINIDEVLQNLIYFRYSKKPLKKHIKIQEHKAPMFVILWCLEVSQSRKTMKLFNNTFLQQKKKKKDVVEIYN